MSLKKLFQKLRNGRIWFSIGHAAGMAGCKGVQNYLTRKLFFSREY
jgi:hypothetical protein